ncbi:beta-1,6-N-acetylglucosaminyltransferase [Mucilaginibacter ginkgonis]|uniref:Peptide O-xylosyltransferase n=1 Tax=Mucilaginibacter ginkgonis TaxID=2682091 RepID=A0A7T7FAI9_9SPHI|nr:beta-1,6-N-acetylglucosaminyltransferase [Mucilaginibacter ginkgonis]QQL49550.1 glycosyl transferase [Mucilaginibacter ginkgonis]
MKIAHLILAHRDLAQVARLVKQIAHPGSFVVIHIDKKCDMQGFLELEKQPDVYLMKNRIDVNWGGYSIVEATINGLRAIVELRREFDFVNLISGQDYPIKPIAEFNALLEENKGKCFFNYCLPGEPWLEEAQQKINTYNLTDWKLKGKYALQKLLNIALPKRTAPAGYTVIGFSAWFTIDAEATRYILKCCDDKLPITGFFKYSWGSDEMFFQTLIYNSPLKDKMVNHNYRYIDWSEKNPRPKTLTMADAPALKASDAFFARKFDQDAEVLDYIDQNLLSNS